MHFANGRSDAGGVHGDVRHRGFGKPRGPDHFVPQREANQEQEDSSDASMSSIQRPRGPAGNADSHESTGLPANREGVQPGVLRGEGYLEAIRPQLRVRGCGDGRRAVARPHPSLPLPEGKLTITG